MNSMGKQFIRMVLRLTQLNTVLDWGLESPQNPPTGMSALRGAG